MRNTFLIILALAAMVFVSCDKTNERLAEQLAGKWMVTGTDGKPAPTDVKAVINFLSATKAARSMSGAGYEEVIDNWQYEKPCDVTITGKTVTLTDNPAKEVTVTVDMTVSRITDQEFAADCKRVVTIGGIKMEPTTSSLQFSRVSKDYSQDILGTWEGRVSSSEGSEHDDGELHRWEYRSDGSYSYYRQDEKGNWVDDVNVHSEYFCDGTLLCTRWMNPGQPEMRESWEIDSIENGVMKWKALRTREDKTTYTATFQMTKVK